ncbi:Store-operated calcium entry regulator STIMATE [Phytophthora cactorum]|nr:Store-operated calcium entry regulator STIMATE [Phytophthora cactorum]
MPPTQNSRRRTRAAARLDIEESRERRKRVRLEKSKAASTAAAPKPQSQLQSQSQFGNSANVHAVMAAQAAIEAEKTPEKKQQNETQEQEGQGHRNSDKEKQESVEEEDGDDMAEWETAMDQEAQEEKQESEEMVSSVDEESSALPEPDEKSVEEVLADEKKDDDDDDIGEREDEVVQEALEKQEMEYSVEPEESSVVPEPEEKSVEETVDEEENIVLDAAVEAEEKSVLPEPMSPDRVFMHSPMEIIGQTKHKTSGIDPTPEKSAPPVVIASKPKKNVARGIAQSSSSASTRKRMISFSPERAPRPENRALALKKLEKNLKTNEKLQQRLEAPTPVKPPAPSRMSSPAIAIQARRPINFTSPQARRPMVFTSPQARRTMPFTSKPTTFTSPPPRRPVLQSPYTVASCSLPLSQTEELEYDPTQEDEEKDISSTEVVLADSGFKSSVVVEENLAAEDEDGDDHSAEEDDGTVMQSADQVGLSQESTSVAHSHVDKLAPLSQESCDAMASHAEADATAAQTDTTSSAFTSTSVIGDVGLFNCETDVEYTGGVYGEGTDGKVTAAVINGQKVALKRAKPHEGFPEHEAKHRAALELHYLRRVRHMKGFLQCLGLCDAIEHTCIALEVMDCKLSDYLRRYGVNSGGSKHRRYTLSFDDTKAMLRQICLPMITLHEDINVAHGDLACRNILMRTPPEGYEQSWEPDIKLSDFGRIKLPSDEPKILDSSFSFHKNCDVGAFGREILYRLLVGEIVPKEYVETRSLHKLLQDVTVTQVPDAAKARLGPYYNLFMRCTAWGVRPTFREIYEHLDELEYFETTENGLFPLKPTGSTDATFMSPVAEGSRHKTPTSSASRSFTEASVPGPNKPVNWLKTRSVGVQRTATQQALTPTAHPMLIKKKRKTPPSAGAELAKDEVEQCVLFSNAASLIAIATLWYKRHVERPRRPLQIWLLDVGKQMIGASAGHFMNLLVSIQMPPVTDECAWYFLNFLSDCTLGMVSGLFMNWVNIQESGEYGNPPSYGCGRCNWRVAGDHPLLQGHRGVPSLIAAATPLGLFGELLFHSLRGYPFAELLLVMIVCPSFLNVVQFWIQTSFLKRDVSVLRRHTRGSDTRSKNLQTNLIPFA